MFSCIRKINGQILKILRLENSLFLLEAMEPLKPVRARQLPGNLSSQVKPVASYHMYT